MKFSIPSIIVALGITTSVHAQVMSYSGVKDLAKTVLTENDYGLTNLKIKDIEEFCPRYSTLSLDEKEDFFAHLVATMAKYESGLNPKTTFVENNGNISAGLLQISYGSLNPIYKKNGCDADSASELKDPKTNLECGFAIIKTLIEDDNNLAKSKNSGASRYWSVLRNPYKVYITAIKRTVTVGKKNVVISDLEKSYKNCF